jgi:hypothetical protein
LIFMFFDGLMLFVFAPFELHFSYLLKRFLFDSDFAVFNFISLLLGFFAFFCIYGTGVLILLNLNVWKIHGKFFIIQKIWLVLDGLFVDSGYMMTAISEVVHLIWVSMDNLNYLKALKVIQMKHILIWQDQQNSKF